MVLLVAVNEPNLKPNTLLVAERREFYNKLLQKWLEDNDILIYSTYRESKSVVVERFIRSLKSKFYKKIVNNKL